MSRAGVWSRKLPASTHSTSWHSAGRDRKSTRLNSSHTVIYTSFPTRRSSDLERVRIVGFVADEPGRRLVEEASSQHAFDQLAFGWKRSEEHTSELQSHSDLHLFPYTTLFRSRAGPNRRLCRR